MTETGYLEWYEFAPQDNLLVVKNKPDMTKKESPSGIIITASKPSVVTDRPSTGIIVSKGPDCKKFEIGQQVFFSPQASFDLEMIRSEGDEKYLMVPEDRVDGLRVKDVRD